MATLLIVEDDKQTNEAICEYLKSAGHKIVPAYDGAEAIQIFNRGNIDLVVLDIMLPKITGLAVLHEIRQKSSVPVLMLTAIEDEYTQVPAICLLPLLQIRSYSRPSKVIVYKIMPRTIQR